MENQEQDLNKTFAAPETVKSEAVLQELELPKEATVKKVVRIVFLLIALGTFLPVWFIASFVALAASAMEPVFLLFIVVVPAIALVVGIFLGVKTKNFLWFILPHVTFGAAFLFLRSIL